MPEALSVADRLDIVAVCTEWAWCIDERRWADLADLFTPSVEFDYTKIFGGEVQTVAPQDVVRNSQLLLGGLTATQHLVSGHVIDGEGDDATCKSQVQATHLLATSTGDPLWTVGGTYLMGMRRQPEGWRIRSIQAGLLWATGNREVMRLGKAQRASA